MSRQVSVRSKKHMTNVETKVEQREPRSKVKTNGKQSRGTPVSERSSGSGESISLKRLTDADLDKGWMIQQIVKDIQNIIGVTTEVMKAV